MPTYKYEEAFYPNPKYPLGSLAPLGSYANPYPAAQGPNYQLPGSTGPAHSTNTTESEIISSPEAHTWSPPAPTVVSQFDREALLHSGTGTAARIPQPPTVGMQAPTSTVREALLPANAISISYSAPSSRPGPPLPRSGSQQLTAFTNSHQRHVHFPEDSTRRPYHNVQQARSGPALIQERSNAEVLVLPAVRHQRDSSALEIVRHGLRTQSSDVWTGLVVQQLRASSTVRIQLPPDQGPRHVQGASQGASALTHQARERNSVEYAARAITVLRPFLLPEAQPGSRTITGGIVHNPVPIDGNRTTDVSVVDDIELRRAKRARPWQLCEICKQKPHLVMEKKIKFCHSCYGEAVAAEKAMSRRWIPKDGSQEG
ncbi:hypothetical protein MMC11_003295 [Xylographa trunciseda]|nr:hypothetical protein [Xylographa trunciseda]